MANAVALLLLISSPTAPEPIALFLKYSPVPPPPAVLLYTFVCAVAVGSVAMFENDKTSSITTDPVPFAVNNKS